MFDSTPDTSRQDQFSQIICSVECTISGCRTLHWFHCHGPKNQIRSIEVSNLEDCRGQGYDNGANMAGIYRGVQARILEKNRGAIFLPCAAHSLNLVGVKSSSCQADFGLDSEYLHIFCRFYFDMEPIKIKAKDYSQMPKSDTLVI